jgi:hypothetical protein
MLTNDLKGDVIICDTVWAVIMDSQFLVNGF